MENQNFKLYSLLHVDLKNNRKNVNMNSSVENPIDIYIKCGLLLAASCRYFGIPYSIITNESNYIKERAKYLGGNIEVTEGNFDRDVPENASFYSAHYKLDIIRDFGRGIYGQNVGLIDLDVVLIKPINFNNFFEKNNSLYIYDISTEERASYGDKVILNSLISIGADTIQHPLWYGGEFIAGKSETFRILTTSIDAIWPSYQKKYQSLHHIGDEMIVTAALSKIRNHGIHLIDSGIPTTHSDYPLITRWWSTRTLCRQVSFTHASNSAFLHLPSDKPFLAKMASSDFEPNNFLHAYRKYAKSKLLKRKIANPFLNLRENQKKFVPNI